MLDLRKQVAEEIRRLQKVLSILGGDDGVEGGGVVGNGRSAPKRRQISAAGRRRIAAAQRARWAKLRSSKKAA